MTGQDLNLALVIKAKADQAKAEIAAVNAEVGKLGAANAAAASQQAKQAAETVQLAAAQQAAAAATAATTAETKVQTEANLAMRASSAGAIREYRALLDEIASGRYRQATGSFAKLVSVLGFMTPTVLATIGAFAGFAAVLGVAAFAEIEAEKDLESYDAAIRKSGLNIGATRGELGRFAEDLAGGSVTVGKAADTVRTLAGSGLFLGTQIRDTARAVLDFGTATQITNDKAVEAFEELSKDPVKTLEKFRDLYDRTTFAQRQEIEALENSGKTAEAAALAFEVLSKRLREDATESDNTRGALEKLFNAIGRGFSEQFFGPIDKGVKGTLSDLQSELERLQKFQKDHPLEEFFVSSNPRIAELQKQIKELLAEQKIGADAIADRQKRAGDAAVEELQKEAAGRDRNIAKARALAELEERIATAKRAGLKGISETPGGPEISFDAFETKQKAAIEKQFSTAKADASRFIQALRDRLSQEEDAEKISFDKRDAFELEFWKNKLAALSAGSKNYIEVFREVQRLQFRIDSQTAAQGKEIAKIQVQSVLDQAKNAIEIKRAQLEQLLNLGQIDKQQEIDGEKRLEDELLRIDKDGLQKRLALENLDPVERARINAEIERLEQQHDLKIVQLASKTALAVRDKWKEILQPIQQAFSQSIQGIVQGTQSVRQAMANILDSIVAEFIDAGIKMLFEHIANQTAMTSATVAGAAARVAAQKSADVAALASSGELGLKQITNDAFQAAAAAFKATAEIPIVGPILAPAAAAAAFVAVEAFGGGIASARGGYYELPSDQLLFAHEREMVLPARFAEGLRDLIANGRAGQSGPSHTTIHAVDAESLMRLLKRNPSAVAAGVRSAARNGAFR